MPSTTRGSILISTANDIGEALVEKLGGVGYSPNDWKNNINLCGIAPVDSAPALSVLSDSAGTGDERGSILIATADAIGAILNKKYNVLRGFKPKEWASAISKLAPLPERAASGSIAHITDGADEVPLKSWEVEIPPTLTGKSAIECTQTGKNLLDTAISETKTHNSVSITCDGNGKYTATGTATGGSANITFTLKTPCTIKSGMYLHLMNSGASGSVSITFQKQDNTTIYAPALSPANRIADLSSYTGQTIYSIRFYIANGASFEMTLTPMVCFSSTATTYEPYQTPTQYTASLGRTIYGGTADVVNGEGTDENGNAFAFTPITPTPETALGTNNFWADEGDSEVTYRAEQEPYTRKTATGGIANFSDQRTDLPLTKAIANIAPSIAGKSAVNLNRTGKNLFDKENPNVVDGYITTTGFSTSNTSAKTVYIPIVGGATYTVSKTAGQRFQIATAEVEPTNNAVFTSRQAGNTSTSLTITASANDKYLWAWIFLDGTDSGTLAEMLNSIQIEVGSSASAYAPYQAPTTYTAELGETVYGGSVDFVSGEVVKEQDKITLNNEGWTYYATSGHNTFNKIITGAEAGEIGLLEGYTFEQVSYISQQSDKCFYFYTSGGNVRISIRDDEYTSAEAFAEHINGAGLVYTLTTPTESTIPGRVISPIEGVNNYWNDAGGDTEIEYFEEESEG